MPTGTKPGRATFISGTVGVGLWSLKFGNVSTLREILYVEKQYMYVIRNAHKEGCKIQMHASNGYVAIVRNQYT